MLKINLLPNARGGAAAAPDNTKIFAIAMAVTAAVLVVGFVLHYNSIAQVAEQERSANSNVEAEVRQIRGRVTDHERVRNELAEIRSRESAIQHLQSARTGPTSMLVEVSHLLSPGGRPTADQQRLDELARLDPQLSFNPGWDTHRVWLLRFTEADRAVVIEGQGQTDEDVGEFMRRLMLSNYFEGVRLEESRGEAAPNITSPMHRFRIVARVRY